LPLPAQPASRMPALVRRPDRRRSLWPESWLVSGRKHIPFIGRELPWSPIPSRTCRAHGSGSRPMAARTVQGMARVRSGQAPAWPLVPDRRGCRDSGVKRDFACTFTGPLPAVFVVLRPQSCLMLEGRTRTLSGPSPDLSPARTLALSACMRPALISSACITRFRMISLD
jgi:hypothetical protein